MTPTPTDRRAELIGRVVLILPTLATAALDGLCRGLTDSPTLRVTTDPTPTEPNRRARPAPPNPLTPENVTLLGAEKTDAIRRVIAAMPGFDAPSLRRLADRLESTLRGDSAPDSTPVLRLARDSTEGGTR